MNYPRYRPPSPGSRRLVNPMSSSTGMVFSSSFDPQYQQPRHSVDTFASPRGSGERTLEAQPISTRTYRDQGQSGTKSRTEYAVRPRRNTFDPEPARRPLSVVIPPNSPNRLRPVVTSGIERPRSPLAKPYSSRDDSERYILPASSTPSRQHHRRIFSADGEDVSRLTVGDKDSKARMERGGYRSSGVGGRRGYPLSGPLVRYPEPDNYDAYSYTGPREQFDRDSAARQRPRQESYSRKDKPLSMAGLDDYLPPVASRREPGQPVTTRGFEKVGRSESLRNNGRSAADSDVLRESDVPRRRTSNRTPISLHQGRDDGYSSYREEYDDPRDTRPRRAQYDDDIKTRVDRQDFATRDDRKHTRTRDDDGDRAGIGGGVSAGLAAGGLATGLVGRHSKESRDQDFERESSRRDPKERRRREADREREIEELAGERERRGEKPRDRKRELDDEDDTVRDRRKERSTRHEPGSESDDDVSDRRYYRHEKRKGGRRDVREEDSEIGSDLRGPTAIPRDPLRRDPRDRDSDQDDSDRRRYRHQRDRILSDEKPVVNTPLDAEEDRPRRVQLVEPVAKETEPPPKSILKPPREKFPEDPTAVREGVAPMKDSGKKGIPPGARWTKIDRRLVNPDALEEGHERFEERSDYVIVLRVLTKEEIQKYAVKTQEIRDARHDEDLEAERRRRKERREKHERDRDRDRERDEDYSEDEPVDPLAIEPPPDSRHPSVAALAGRPDYHPAMAESKQR